MDNLQQIKELKDNHEVLYTSLEPVKKAQEALRYIANQMNLTVITNLGLQSILQNTKRLADCLPVPFDIAAKIASFPAVLIKLDDPKMFVALVCYNGGQPIDVLMLNSSLFAGGKKPIKLNKKSNEYIVKIKDIKHKTLQPYTFGTVIEQLQR